MVDGLISGGFDGLIGSGFDGFDMGSRWCWVRLRLVMGLICVCWVDPFDRWLGLIDCICWVNPFAGFDLVFSHGFDSYGFGFTVLIFCFDGFAGFQEHE